jgi:hypothetical protein
MTEAREMPAEYGWMAKPTPVQPSWKDFDIDGKPLFETCSDYLDRARALVAQARALAKEVHGDSQLTSPPNEM